MRSLTLVALALVTLMVGACGREQTVQPHEEKVISGCPCDRPLPQKELEELTKAAATGDRAAEIKLYEYYVWRGEAEKAAPLENRLVAAGYPDAIGHRSDMLFSEAYDLKDTDPRKLALIKQSLDLEARYRKATAGRVLHVMVNGKYVDIRQTGKPDEGTKNMQRILARVAAAQGER